MEGRGKANNSGLTESLLDSSTTAPRSFLHHDEPKREIIRESKPASSLQTNKPFVPVHHRDIEAETKTALKKNVRKASVIGETKNERDVVFAKEGYRWDVVFVLPTNAIEGAKYTHTHLLGILKAGGLQHYSFYSSKRDLIFVKIRASLERLETEAMITGYRVILDEEKLGRIAATGVKDPETGKVIVKPLELNGDQKLCRYRPFQFIYSSYTVDKDSRGYQLFCRPKGSLHPFNSTDRIKLIFSILESLESIGCGLELTDLKEDGSVIDYFPLRDKDICERVLVPAWLPWSVKSWKQPIDAIREYFGEKIAMYFSFLGHLTTYLLPIGIVGLVVMLDVIGESTDENGNYSVAYGLGHARLIPLFGLLIALWSQILLEYWKRKESTNAMMWGMSNFEESERNRHEFEGEIIRSPSTGKMITYFPQSVKRRRVAWSSFIIGLAVLFVIGCVSLLFFIKLSMTRANLEDFGNILVPILNAVQVQVLNEQYKSLALYLNKNENHRTDTEYEDALILKLFAFQFVNSYAALFYIAFIKEYMGDPCLFNCMAELAQTLVTIVASQIGVKLVFDVVLPYVEAYKAKRSSSYESQLEKKVSVVEEEYALEPYDIMMDILLDYSELSIRFGFITLFVCSCPVIPFLVYVSYVFEIRLDASDLLYKRRRPIPTGCQDIGTWMTIFELTANLSVITNSAIICFTMSIIDEDASTRVWLFIIFQYMIFTGMYLFSALIDDVPEDVSIQLEREEQIKEKIIDSDADDDDEDDEEESFALTGGGLKNDNSTLVNDKDDEIV